MSSTENLSLEEIEALAQEALVASGATEANARPLAVATAETEKDGVASHGLAYIPIYCGHLECGKVDGKAEPVLEQTRDSMITVDAACGFAHRPIDMGFEKLIPLARKNGIAALAIHNSYNCGVLGYHTRRLAEAGMVGLGFTNSPAAIAPAGGSKPVFGTNPMSIAAPGAEGEAEILIDQSSSAIAKSEVMKHAREGKDIPLGWALDSDGNPTTDPEAGLKGSMVPTGGYKGVGNALLVEIMAAALTGATLGIHASPFSGPVGGPPKTGQFFIAIDPRASSRGEFEQRIAAIADSIRSQPGARLPGDGRRARRDVARQKGVDVNTATLAKIRELISAAG